MPKFKVREVFTDGSKQNFYADADTEANALAICETLFGGSHEVLETPADIVVTEPALTAVAYKKFGVTLKNENTDTVAFIDILVKDSKTSNDVITVLRGKTINGVLAQSVTIHSIRHYAV